MLLPCCLWVCNLCFYFGWCYCQLLVFFMADGDVVPSGDVCIGRCYYHFFCGCWYYHFDHKLYQKVYHCCCFLMADVIARMADGIALYMIGRCYCRVADVFTTILFFVLLADVIAWWLMLLPLLCSFVGRCCCLMADGMPTMGVDGRCYCQSGRWISLWVNGLILNLRFCVGPHPICEADGTCLCFCLGMGH